MRFDKSSLEQATTTSAYEVESKKLAYYQGYQKGETKKSTRRATTITNEVGLVPLRRVTKGNPITTFSGEPMMKEAIGVDDVQHKKKIVC